MINDKCSHGKLDFEESCLGSVWECQGVFLLWSGRKPGGEASRTWKLWKLFSTWLVPSWLVWCGEMMVEMFLKDCLRSSAVYQMISLLCVFLIGGGGNHLWKGNHSSVYFESNTGNLSQQWLFHFKTWYSYVETRLTTIKNIMEIFVDDPFWLFPASLYCVD